MPVVPKGIMSNHAHWLLIIEDNKYVIKFYMNFAFITLYKFETHKTQ